MGSLLLSALLLLAMAMCGQIGGENREPMTEPCHFRPTPRGSRRPVLLPPRLVALRGGRQTRAKDNTAQDEIVGNEETPSGSMTPDSDMLMREAEAQSAPLSQEQIAQLRALPLAELLPLGETLPGIQF